MLCLFICVSVAGDVLCLCICVSMGDVLCLCICVSVGGCVVSVYLWGGSVVGKHMCISVQIQRSPEAGVTIGWGALDVGVGN